MFITALPNNVFQKHLINKWNYDGDYGLFGAYRGCNTNMEPLRGRFDVFQSIKV